MNNKLPNSNYSELLLLLLRKRKRFRVKGNSMLPLLSPGTEILLDPHAYEKSLPKIGDIVVTIYPGDLSQRSCQANRNLQIVKRITRIMDDGSLFLEGDNPAESTDSRTWGTVELKDIVGKVTSLFD